MVGQGQDFEDNAFILYDLVLPVASFFEKPLAIHLKLGIERRKNGFALLPVKKELDISIGPMCHLFPVDRFQNKGGV